MERKEEIKETRKEEDNEQGEERERKGKAVHGIQAYLFSVPFTGSKTSSSVNSLLLGI